MTVDMFCIFDVKSSIFMSPSYFHNEPTALRAYRKELGKPDSMINMFPEDYQIYCVGKFDDARGVLVALDKPEFVISVKDLLESKTDVTKTE